MARNTRKKLASAAQLETLNTVVANVASCVRLVPLAQFPTVYFVMKHISCVEGPRVSAFFMRNGPKSFGLLYCVKTTDQ